MGKTVKEVKERGEKTRISLSLSLSNFSLLVPSSRDNLLIHLSFRLSH